MDPRELSRSEAPRALRKSLVAKVSLFTRASSRVEGEHTCLPLSAPRRTHRSWQGCEEKTRVRRLSQLPIPSHTQFASTDIIKKKSCQTEAAVAVEEEEAAEGAVFSWVTGVSIGRQVLSSTDCYRLLWVQFADWTSHPWWYCPDA